ncbi:NAD(P)H-dependent oxidoreductase subunit E [candidate division KSB1 bacterium]
MKRENIISIVDKHDRKEGSIIAILEGIQSQYSYLPEEALKIVAERTGKSLVDIFGVATFYKSFSLKPRGKHLISVCLGTACHVRGGPAIVDEFESHLKIKAGETTPDKEISLESVNCLGACALGPIAVVDGHYFSNVKRSMVKDIIKKTRERMDSLEVKTDERIFPLDLSCPKCNHSFMDKNFLIDDHPSIRVTISFKRKHGWLRLSRLYGSFKTESEYEIPKDTLVNFFCPHCHSELSRSTDCIECGAAMVPMIVKGGGVIQICSRKGCKGHILDLT